MPDRCSFYKLVGGPLVACRRTHGLRDRLGRPEFQTSLPVFFFFFSHRKLGLERWLPPERLSWVLLCLLFFLPLLSVLFSLLAFSFLVVVRLMSSSSCRRCAFWFLVVFFVLLPLAVAHVVGGFSAAWVVMHGAVSVSFLLLRLALKKAREVPPCACVVCLFFSLSRPLASCPYVVFMLCLLFLMHAHAWRRRPLGLGFTASCVAALLSQAPSPSGPPVFPWSGSCCPHHG